MQESSQSNSLSLDIREILRTGATILAPNERAAADLRSRFDQAQSAAGFDAWEPAQIRSWNAWLESLWSTLVNEGADLRLLLNQPQEHTLWREIIAADTPTLGSPDALADLAQSAWRLAASYEATADLRRFAVTHDSRTFAAWAAAFTKRCDRAEYLSTAELSAAIRTHIENGTLVPPSNLLLIGFDDDTPARTSLLTTLAIHGCTIERHAITSEPAPEPGWPILRASAKGGVSGEARPLSSTPAPLHAIVRATNPQEEIQTASHWLRHFIETSNLNPSPLTPQQIPLRIALIIPTLQDERPALEASLRNILAPELQSIAADISSAPYAFNTGIPLADTAMIAAALDLIRWIVDPLPIDRVTALLLSPYIGTFADLEIRAAFDAFKLRSTPMLRPEIDIARLTRIAQKSPAITHLLTPHATRAARLTPDTRRSHADWMDFIRDTLHDANFPGDRPLNAQEFRDARTWDHTLDAVATLDFAGDRVDFATALQALERQARATSTSPGPSNASVQIMTPTEAAGSSFDAVVFLRATDANWPTPERANPLLGWPLQHDRQMPGTGPARTAVRADEATQRLIAAAPTVLFFYAAEDETGPLRLSPIIGNLGLPIVDAVSLISVPETEIIPTETFPDAESLPALPSGDVIGGARVLKQQAACGFLAFSELRLRSRPISDIAAGLDAMESGNFLHRAMQAFWSEVKSQDDLRRMDSADREALLVRCITNAVDNSIEQQTPWDTAYLQIQKDRLLILLRLWLNAELDRGPFTVLALETDTMVSVGPLTLSVRMDRIDRVADGFVYVDYKTGSAANISQWDGERPDDPQLPLYALLSQPGELKGLAFAKVRAGKGMAWLGYQAESGILPMKRPSTVDIDLLIGEWRQTLTMLAEDFANGRATVSPKDFAINCARCTQRLLCRVNPELLLLNPEDDEGNDAE
jgi:ATP-dependent helicase/nuclease subunit B